MDLEIKTHALAVEFDSTVGAWIEKDSNYEEPVRISTSPPQNIRILN